jgi:tetratricopeptide (TPR) repeat protein
MALRIPLIPALGTLLLVAACAPPEERAAEFLTEARALYAAGDLDTAMLEAKNAVQIEPRNAEARFLMAEILEKEGNLREVVSNLLIVVDTEPRNLDAQLKLGTLFFYGTEYGQAERYATAAAAIAPEDPRVRLLQARLRFQAEQAEEGFALVDAVLAGEPGNQDALVLKAMALARTDPAAARALLDAALASVPTAESQALRRVRLGLLDTRTQAAEIEAELLALARDFPEDSDYVLQLAQLYRQQGKVDQAEKVMREFVARRPDDMPARLGLVQFLAQARGPEVAEETLKQFVQERPDVPQLRQALGRRYEATGRDAEALAIYRELAAEDPKSATGLAARREIAKAAFRAGEVEEGRAAIAAILEDSPDDPDALVLRAGLRYDAGEYDEAIADLRVALRRRPEFQSALLLLGRVYVRSGDVTLATDTYRRLLQVSPGHPEALAELPPLLLARGDVAGASAVIEKNLELAPQDLQALGRLAEVRIRQRDYAAAEALARRMMAVEGQDGLGEFELGRVLAAQDKHADAAASFRAALAARPADVVVLDGLVQSLVAAGRADAAVTTLESYIAANPGQVQAKYLLGVVHAREGRADLARPLFDAAIAAQPGVAVYHYARAGLEPDAAGRIEILRRGRAAAPDNAGIALRLADEYERARRYDEAIGVYEELLGKPGAPDDAVNNLAALLLDHRTDDASLKRALALATPFAGSTDPARLDTLGWAHYRNRDYAQAVPLLERAVAAAGQVAQLHYHLGMAYVAAGNPVGARDQLTRATADPKIDYTGRADAEKALAALK